MPNTWITHIGTPFHGMDITWNHDPSAAIKTLSVTIAANIYSTPMFILAKPSSSTGPNMTGIATGAQSAAYEFKVALTFSIYDYASSSITCAHTNYTGTTVCFDGILIHYDCIGTAGGGLPAAPAAQVVEYSTMTVWNKPYATATPVNILTTYDLAPTTYTDTATTDVTYMAPLSSQDYKATNTAWFYSDNTAITNV